MELGRPNFAYCAYQI